MLLVNIIPPCDLVVMVNTSPCTPVGVYAWPLRRQMGVAGPGAGFIPRTAVEDGERSPALVTRHLYHLGNPSKKVWKIHT